MADPSMTAAATDGDDDDDKLHQESQSAATAVVGKFVAAISTPPTAEEADDEEDVTEKKKMTKKKTERHPSSEVKTIVLKNKNTWSALAPGGGSKRCVCGTFLGLDDCLGCSAGIPLLVAHRII